MVAGIYTLSTYVVKWEVEIESSRNSWTGWHEAHEELQNSPAAETARDPIQTHDKQKPACGKNYS